MPKTDWAAPDIRGHAIKLAVSQIVEWSGQSGSVLNGLMIVRRQGAYPINPYDGEVVLDIEDLVGEMDENTLWVQRTVLCDPHPSDKGQPPQVINARMDYYYITTDSPHPYKIRLVYGDAAAQILTFENITRLEFGPQQVVDHRVTDTISFHQASGSTEQLAGQVLISSNYTAGSMESPGGFEWYPDGIDSQAPLITKSWSTRTDLNAYSNPDTGDWKIDVTVTDVGLPSGETAYYSIFPYANRQLPIKYWRPIRLAATPTGQHQLDERLYRMLPAIHQNYDEPTPDQKGRGQLRRFLQCFGRGFDQLRSRAEELRQRHDVRRVHADALPHLAHYIGWDLDRTADEIAQRSAILQAPELYRSVGTIPNLKVLVNHITGWDCRVREYVHNIAKSNAPETVQLWEIYERRFDGAEWLVTTPVSADEPLPEQFDGRPTAVVAQNWDTDNRELHLYWHTNRNGKWEIWHRKEVEVAQGDPVDDVDPDGDGLKWSEPDIVDTDPSNGAAVPTAVKELTAVSDPGSGVLLFWSALCNGQWNIWGHSSARVVERITDHPAEERRPSAVIDQEQRIWLFWQSNRRGLSDIWYTSRESEGNWHRPRRLTHTPSRDAEPAACMASDDHICLFWSAEQAGQSNIYAQVYSKSDNLQPLLSSPQAITVGPHRDESPTAVSIFNGSDVTIRLLWHSNRDGKWQIWQQEFELDTSGQDPVILSHSGAPTRFTEKTTGDKEPSIVLDPNSQWRVFWRSQQRGWLYQSRSFRNKDKAKMGTFEDRLHYTFETGKDKDHRYTPDTIGIYIKQDTENAALRVPNRLIVDNVVERFLPARVRAVPIIEPATFYEKVYPDNSDLPRDEDEDAIETEIVPMRNYSALSIDGYLDTVRGWISAHSWSDDSESPWYSIRKVSNRPKYRTWHVGVEVEQDQGFVHSYSDNSADPWHTEAGMSNNPEYRTWHDGKEGEQEE